MRDTTIIRTGLEHSRDAVEGLQVMYVGPVPCSAPVGESSHPLCFPRVSRLCRASSPRRALGGAPTPQPQAALSQERMPAAG